MPASSVASPRGRDRRRRRIPAPHRCARSRLPGAAGRARHHGSEPSGRGRRHRRPGWHRHGWHLTTSVGSARVGLYVPPDVRPVGEADRLSERRAGRCVRRPRRPPPASAGGCTDRRRRRRPGGSPRPASPDSVTPRSGTKSSSIRRRTENENVRVPTRIASVALSRRSRYQRRMTRAENVPVAIWTTSTVTVMTKPVSAAVAPTIDVRTALAVEGEYCQSDGARRAHRRPRR